MSESITALCDVILYILLSEYVQIRYNATQLKYFLKKNNLFYSFTFDPEGRNLLGHGEVKPKNAIVTCWVTTCWNPVTYNQVKITRFHFKL